MLNGWFETAVKRRASAFLSIQNPATTTLPETDEQFDEKLVTYIPIQFCLHETWVQAVRRNSRVYSKIRRSL